MECPFCENQNAYSLECGHNACEEHLVFVRQNNRLIPVCIACYEEAIASANNLAQAKEKKDGS